MDQDHTHMNAEIRNFKAWSGAAAVKYQKTHTRYGGASQHHHITARTLCLCPYEKDGREGLGHEFAV